VHIATGQALRRGIAATKRSWARVVVGAATLTLSAVPVAALATRKAPVRACLVARKSSGGSGNAPPALTGG